MAGNPVEDAHSILLDLTKDAMETYMAHLRNNAKRRAPIRKVLREQAGRSAKRWRAVGGLGAGLMFPGAAGSPIRSNVSAMRHTRFMEAVRAEGWYQELATVKTKKGTVLMALAPKSRQSRYSARRGIEVMSSGKPRNRQGMYFGVSRSAKGVTYEDQASRRGIFVEQETWNRLTAEGRREVRRGAIEYFNSVSQGYDTGRGGLIPYRVESRAKKERGSKVVGEEQVEQGQSKYGSTEGADYGYGSGVAFHRGERGGAGRFGLQIGGRLRRGIEEEVTVEGNRVIGTLRSTAPYSIYVEYGTQKHGKAQPFMRPTFIEAHQSALGFFNERIKAGARKGT